MNSALCIVGLIVGVVCGAVSANIMKSKGRSEGAGWALGLLLGVIGLIIAAVLSPDESAMRSQQLASGTRKQCVACKELIDSGATICPRCRTAQ